MGSWRVDSTTRETSPLDIGSQVDIDNAGDPPRVQFNGVSQTPAIYIQGDRSLVFAGGHLMRIASEFRLSGSKGRPSDGHEAEQPVGTWGAEGSWTAVS